MTMSAAKVNDSFMDCDDVPPTLVSTSTSGQSSVASSNSKNLSTERVPVTILTGFLGAGKSTLLHRILSEHHGMRIAVIMNELGANGSVDQASIWDSGVSSDEWISLENGCLCCSARDETTAALDDLIRRRPEIDHILVEASGAADPAQLAEKLWCDEALESAFVLDAVVCVVDATFIHRLLSPTDPSFSLEASRQLAIADVILLNKIDLLTSKQNSSATTIEEITSMLLKANPLSRVIPTERCNVNLNQVFGIKEYESRDEHGNSKFAAHAALEQSLALQSLDDNSTAIKDQTLHRRMSSFSINLRRPFVSLDVFERWLFTLLWERVILPSKAVLDKDDEILRIKGIVCCGVDPTKSYALQVVREKYDIQLLTRNHSQSFVSNVESSASLPYMASLHDVSERETSIVFIGRWCESTHNLLIESLHQLSCVR